MPFSADCQIESFLGCSNRPETRAAFIYLATRFVSFLGVVQVSNARVFKEAATHFMRSGTWSLSWSHRGDLKSRTTSQALSRRFKIAHDLPCTEVSMWKQLPARRIRCTFCPGTCVDESRLGGEEGGQSLQITGLDLFFCFDRFRKQCEHDVHI